MTCFQCGGPYHPATGHIYPEWDVAFCGGCYKPFVKWLRGHLKREWSGHSFYEEASRSLGARPPGRRRYEIHHPDCEEPVERAGGGVECRICGREYYDHPYCSSSWNEGMDCHSAQVLCDGRHVHL